MTPTTAEPRPVLHGSLRLGAAAAVGFAGALVLAGCAGATPAEETTEPTSETSTAPTAETTDAATGSSTSVYENGTYTAEGSYATPESVEAITVTVTLDADVITDVQVTGDPQKQESEEYQSKFIGGISDVVVGQPIDEIAVTRVAGSSLTSSGFNDAIETIKSEAAA